MPEPLSINEITLLIRDLFELEPRLQDVWVEGEISNFKRAASGHLYFTLKDDKSELPCVMWRTQAGWLGFEPQHGDSVLAHGRVTVYEARGQYQLYCDALQPAGVGELNRQFELLKARLDAEGLFAPELKRPIPPFPRRIGVVTSPTTAAFQDILNVLQRRFPLGEVVLSPTPVQGKDAPPQIVEAIQRLNAYGQVDVILVARGGGSLEDLWCFNDEDVVRAVAASDIPIVTGVGHEIDFTLVDFAADQRAPTPSAAAELIAPDSAALRLDVAAAANRLDEILLDRLDGHHRALEAERRLLERLSPLVRVQNARQRIDEFTSRIDTHLRHGLARRRDRLDARIRALESANPTALLARGYALVTRTSDGQRVTSVQHAAEGTWITIALHDGQLGATVRERSLDHDTQE